MQQVVAGLVNLIKAAADKQPLVTVYGCQWRQRRLGVMATVPTRYSGLQMHCVVAGFVKLIKTAADEESRRGTSGHGNGGDAFMRPSAW
jgi:hypothetical protein